MAFSGCHPRSSLDCIYKSAFEDGPSSSNPGIHAKRSVVVAEELLGHARSEVAEMYDNFRGVPFIFQGYGSNFFLPTSKKDRHDIFQAMGFYYHIICVFCLSPIM